MARTVQKQKQAHPLTVHQQIQPTSLTLSLSLPPSPLSLSHTHTCTHTVLSHWNFSPWEIRGKQAATNSRFPNHGACWMFDCFQNPPKSVTDSRILNVRTDVDACNRTLGCTERAEPTQPTHKAAVCFASFTIRANWPM